jgi:hypothetical protein
MMSVSKSAAPLLGYERLILWQSSLSLPLIMMMFVTLSKKAYSF